MFILVGIKPHGLFSVAVKVSQNYSAVSMFGVGESSSSPSDVFRNAHGKECALGLGLLTLLRGSGENSWYHKAVQPRTACYWTTWSIYGAQTCILSLVSCFLVQIGKLPKMWLKHGKLHSRDGEGHFNFGWSWKGDDSKLSADLPLLPNFISIALNLE